MLPPGPGKGALRHIGNDVCVVSFDRLQLKAYLCFGALNIFLPSSLRSRWFCDRFAKSGGFVIDALEDFSQCRVGNDGCKRFACFGRSLCVGDYLIQFLV